MHGGLHAVDYLASMVPQKLVGEDKDVAQQSHRGIDAPFMADLICTLGC
jgi:hypothetical protein